MHEVDDVLRRLAAGQKLREIARATGLDRKTVRRYAQASGDGAAELSVVLKKVQGRKRPAPSAARRMLGEHRKRISDWLKPQDGSRPLRLRKVHVLLERRGVRVSYATLCRFVHDELSWGERRATVLLDDPPAGEEAQVDFGLLAHFFDPEHGAMRKLWCLVVTLTHSRMLFAWPTFAQTTEAICEGLDAAWHFFGGIPKHILIDNMKAAIHKSDRIQPVVTEAFADYARARSLFVDTARVREPRDKARVENQVPFVRENFFDGEQFADLRDVRERAERWSRDAAERVHGTTHRVVREHFEREERGKLAPPPESRFDVPHWVNVHVQRDHHVRVLCALYSVPTRYIGRKVSVRADSELVRVYYQGDIIKTHPRQKRGERSTDPCDYPPGKEIYATRNADALRARARELGGHVGEYAERLLAHTLPWTKMRQTYRLLRLCEAYGTARVDALCARSLSFDVVDVSRIQGMLQNALSAEATAEDEGVLRRLSDAPRFARSGDSFRTRREEVPS